MKWPFESRSELQQQENQQVIANPLRELGKRLEENGFGNLSLSQNIGDNNSIRGKKSKYIVYKNWGGDHNIFRLRKSQNFKLTIFHVILIPMLS